VGRYQKRPILSRRGVRGGENVGGSGRKTFRCGQLREQRNQEQEKEQREEAGPKSIFAGRGNKQARGNGARKEADQRMIDSEKHKCQEWIVAGKRGPPKEML